MNPFSFFRFSILHLGIAIFILCSHSTYAQEGTANYEDSKEELYKIEEIGSQSEKTQQLIRNINTELDGLENTAELDSAKVHTIEKTSYIKNLISEDAVKNLGVKEAGDLKDSLQLIYERLTAMRDVLNKNTTLISNRTREVNTQISRWQQTLNTKEIANLPKPVEKRINSNITDLGSTVKKLNAHNEKLLTTQDEITSIILILDQTRTEFNAELELHRSIIYENKNLPLWKISTLKTDSTSLAQNFKTSLQRKSYTLTSYRSKLNYLIIFWLSCIFVVLTLIFWIRYKYKQRSIEEYKRHKRETPYYGFAALLIGTLLTIIFFADAPPIVINILCLILIAPILSVLPKLWPRIPRKYFTLSVLSILIAVVTNIFSELEIINRMLLLANSILVTIIFVTLLTWINENKRGQRVLPINYTMLIIGILSAVFSLICNLMGNIFLMDIFFAGSITAAFGGILLFSVRKLLNNFINMVVIDRILGDLNIFINSPNIIVQTLKKIVSFLAYSYWVILVANSFVVLEPTYHWLANALSNEWQLGAMTISLGNIVAFIITFVITIYLSRIVRFLLEGEVFIRTKTSRGAAGAILMLFRLVMIAIAFILAMGAADIDISNITIIFGALGVGIGFGLQTIFNNLASGIILAFEQPIKAGDVVQIHSLNLMGEVKEIGIRASIITTFDGADVIVPNGNIISNEMINWTLSSNLRRQELLVGVAYGTNLSLVSEILENVIKEQDGVLKDPNPRVLFSGFGDSSLDFRVLFWTKFEDGLYWKSIIGIAIDNAFKKANITIPFPQRDLHIIPAKPANINNIAPVELNEDLLADNGKNKDN